MKFFVDIDGTICSQSENGDYSQAVPLKEHIAMVNRAYDAGHKIVYWTARGTVTRTDWRELTEKQLKEWGAKYHDLQFGKPAYDVLLDDRAISIGWLKDL